MRRRKFMQSIAGSGIGLMIANPLSNKNTSIYKETPVGVIGLDTSHSVAFTEFINASGEYRVTHAYPYGSREIESSFSRIPGYTEDMKGLGVTIAESIDQLLNEVDAVLLETNDGRLHLAQALQVFEARKPVFIDKPIAASLSDVKEIFKNAKQSGVPVFSASALRFSPSTVAVASGKKIGEVFGADTYSPAYLEATHPDLYWYGMHGVEALYTVMGTGCSQVRRIHREGTDMVIGEWSDGRVGTFRGLRSGKPGYGGYAFGAEGIAPIGAYEGYEPLVNEIIRFFRSGLPPVSDTETTEIFAFMEAAEVSKKRGGEPVRLEEVLTEHD